MMKTWIRLGIATVALQAALPASADDSYADPDAAADAEKEHRGKDAPPVSQNQTPSDDPPCGGSQTDYADFCVMIDDVPDFDQLRNDRLSLDGNYHCIPTSTLNVLSWLSNQGYVDGYEDLDRPNTVDNQELYCSSDEALRERDGLAFYRRPFTPMCADSDAWREDVDAYTEAGGVFALLGDALRYERVSTEIEALGFELNTNGISGPDDVRTEDDPTGTEDIGDAADAILARSEDVDVAVFRGANCNPTVGLAPIRSTLENGGIALVTIGFYSPDEIGSSTLARTGGHIVTLNGLHEEDGASTIYFRDPARMGGHGDLDRTWPMVLCDSDGDCNDRQDPFFTETGAMTREVIDIVDGDETCSRERWAITWADGKKRGYLDALVTVIPD